MWDDKKIIIVDDNDQRRHELQVIFTFMDEAPAPFDHAQWSEISRSPEGCNNTRQISALFMGESAQNRPLAERVSEVAEWDPSTPIVLIGEHPLDELNGSEHRNRIVATLDYPLSHTKLLDTLHRTQLYREQYDRCTGNAQQREVTLFRSLVGTSPQIQSVRQMMAQVADKDVTVMILGESGTGKEVVARNLHYSSSRRDKPFVPVNCGAIPRELLESELFGHEKGAFTGAVTSRAGRFEMAKGGTLFLDEIGDMPLDMQVKILRVLQERCFERVGSNKMIEADVRVITATHKNLEEMIEKGTFREDLFYRLNVFPIDMPPLRERAEDIPLLLNELICRREHENRGSIRFNSAAIQSICKHEWAGNVRELANLVERMAITHPEGVIGVQDLPRKFRHIDEGDESIPLPEIAESASPASAIATPAGSSPQLPSEGIDLKDYLAGLERDLIQQALDEAKGVVARAADKLGIRRTTLVEKMRKYDLQRG